MGILALMEVQRRVVDGKEVLSLRKISLSAITCSKILSEKTGKPFSIGLIGNGLSGIAEQVKNYGAESVFLIEGEGLERVTAQSFSLALSEFVNSRGFEYVIASTSTFSKDLLPRLSALIDAAMASDIVEVIDGKTFKRPVYAGSAVATVRLSAPKIVLTARPTAFEPAETVEKESPVERVEAQKVEARMRWLAMHETKSERPDLTEAQVVVSGGRGLKGPDGFKMIEQLADLLGGAVGATRAAVDAGWVPNDLQVGQTGKTVAPTLYFAIAISGAIQHVAGMKDSKVIVAINKDGEAPIFQVSDYGLVGDAFKIVPEIIEKIRELKRE